MGPSEGPAGLDPPLLFQDRERAATWLDLPLWPVIIAAWMALFASFVLTLR